MTRTPSIISPSILSTAAERRLSSAQMRTETGKSTPAATREGSCIVGQGGTEDSMSSSPHRPTKNHRQLFQIMASTIADTRAAAKQEADM